MTPSRALAIVPALLSAALALSSCKDDGKPDDAQKFAEQYCDLFMDCCAQAGLSTDGSACRGWVSLASAMGTYDAEAGAACIAETEAAKGNADFCISGFSGDACDRVFSSSSTGTRQPGETCSEDEDCAASADGEPRCFAVYHFENGSSTTTKTCMIEAEGKDQQGTSLFAVYSRPRAGEEVAS